MRGTHGGFPRPSGGTSIAATRLALGDTHGPERDRREFPQHRYPALFRHERPRGTRALLVFHSRLRRGGSGGVDPAVGDLSCRSRRWFRWRCCCRSPAWARAGFRISAGTAIWSGSRSCRSRSGQLFRIFFFGPFGIFGAVAYAFTIGPLLGVIGLIAAMVLIYFWCQPGDAAANAYGAPPDQSMPAAAP